VPHLPVGRVQESTRNVQILSASRHWHISGS
jgi:hypothetical protein